MNGYTPVELEIRAKDRAAWLADVNDVLFAFAAEPDLPKPLISSRRAIFYLDATIGGVDAPEVLDAAVAALSFRLGVKFEGRIAEDGRHWLEEAKLNGGLLVQVSSFAECVAEHTPAGWVRKVARKPVAA